MALPVEVGIASAGQEGVRARQVEGERAAGVAAAATGRSLLRVW